MIHPTGNPIQRLPEHVINQIAAGEVIERPASVVKELVENAIDAGAVNIEVEVEEGGKRSIRVLDDGLGISSDELPLALASHATSKLRNSEDLERILTLGFRGEALASIASVADVDLVSRPPGTEIGERVEATATGVERGRPEVIAPGTRITVKNLFYRVPARKRFLKSERAELGRISSALKQIALATPTVGFSLRNDGKLVFRVPCGQEERDRVTEILGEADSSELLEVSTADGRLTGWVGRPDVHRQSSRAIYAFLNGRPIRDSVVIHALRAGYRGFQIPGRYPVAVVSLTLDPGEFNVNVHPAKLEVRFRDSSAVHSLVYHAVRTALEGEGSVPSLLPGGASPSQNPASPTSGPPTSRPSSSRSTTFGGDAGWRGLMPQRGEPAHPDAVREGDSVASRAVETTPDLVDGRELRVFQVRNSFLVVEEEDGLTIIDQHALHEKILYEEICEARERGELRQGLLIPETLKLSPTQLESFSEAEPHLNELGFDVEIFGEQEIVVRAVPAGLNDVSVPDLLADVLERVAANLRHGAGGAIELREDLLATMACKRAVKAGQPLSPPMQLDLIHGRARAFQPQNCPHGRPSEIFMRWEDLERRFDRK